jgi:putative transposase
MAALICTRPGHRSRLIYRIHLDRAPAKGRRKGFTETDYARLLDAAHQQLAGPIILIWDNLNTHVSRTPTRPHQRPHRQDRPQPPAAVTSPIEDL